MVFSTMQGLWWLWGKLTEAPAGQQPGADPLPGPHVVAPPIFSAPPPFNPLPPAAKPDGATAASFGQRVKLACLRKGYTWDTGADAQNVVSVENCDMDGSHDGSDNNSFNCVKMVLDAAGNIIGGPWRGTTHPGRYWTKHPMDKGGAFIIALGQQSCWTPGEYHGKTVWRQAENSTILGHRDLKCTYTRVGPPVVHGNIGIHHHGGYNLPRHDIKNAAAGCQVIEYEDGQADFMKLTLSYHKYLANKRGFRLTATVIEHKDL